MENIKKTLNEIANNFSKLANQSSRQIDVVYNIIINSLENEGKLMFCGNGGSAADSQHLSAELVGRYMKNRKPLPSIALTTDTSVITAISNDFSFDEIFSRQIESVGKKGDVLYAITTSGKSKNIISALKKAKNMGIKTVCLTGNNSNDVIDFCDAIINVPSSRPDRIQEMHIAIGQIICEMIEQELC
tara:strand:- start:1392 stop:1955 length:564 start_codon:yes stop_codon:yes gene_type:complete